MRKEFLFMLAFLLLPNLASAVATMSANCSHITVIGDSGTFFDIEWLGPDGWGSVSGVRMLPSTGAYTYQLELNGTHRLKAGPSLYGISLTGQTLEVTTCAAPKPCTAKSDCDAGQYCSSGACTMGECASNTDCANDKTCNTQSHACVSIPCVCGKVENHACTKFQCCFDANCTGGKICVSNACVENATGSAGGTGGSGNSGQGTGSGSGNNGTTGTGSGNTGGSGGTSGQAGSDASGGAGQSFLSSGLGLVCIGGVGLFFVFIIGLFFIVALVAVFYKRK
ncbi:MAG: hypothetical protein V1909_04590 [Candidatus Micrarchaeota archaeon]